MFSPNYLNHLKMESLRTLSTKISSVFSFVFLLEEICSFVFNYFCKKMNFNAIELPNIPLIGFLKTGLACTVVNKGIEGY